MSTFKLLEKVQELGLPREHFVIAGSLALKMHGLLPHREPDDADLILSGAIWDHAIQNKGPRTPSRSIPGRENVETRIDGVQIFDLLRDPGDFNFNGHIPEHLTKDFHDAIWIDGFLVNSPRSIAAHKSFRARPKDINDLANCKFV